MTASSHHANWIPFALLTTPSHLAVLVSDPSKPLGDVASTKTHPPNAAMNELNPNNNNNKKDRT